MGRVALIAQVLSDVEKGQRLAKVLGAISFLALTALLGQGQMPWSIPSIVSLLLMASSAFAYNKLAALQQRFHYEPWSQADLKD